MSSKFSILLMLTGIVCLYTNHLIAGVIVMLIGVLCIPRQRTEQQAAKKENKPQPFVNGGLAGTTETGSKGG